MTINIDKTKKRIAKTLRDAAQLLKENGWIRSSYAKNAQGEIVPPKAQDACKFCTVGAIERVIPPGNQAPFTRSGALRAVRYVTNHTAVDFNDHHARDKRHVIRTLERAADKLEKGEVPL